MFLAQVIKSTSSYANEQETTIIKSFAFDIEKEAKAKKKDLIKEFDMKKIGHTFINNKSQEIFTNF